MLSSLASVCLTITLNVSLIHVIGFLIFPLSTSIAEGLNLMLLLRMVPKKIGPIEIGPLIRYGLTLILAALCGGASAWAVNGFLAARLGTGLLASLASVVASGGLGLVVFYSASRVLGIQETREFVRRFLRR